ncbi:NADH-quinone oxidoreductase subunit L [Cytophagaceae bacterium ABcell3]|nr:NADH-quinone oxidoreductase subunit L [Cytophagaceae bacterium ABcell3]
MKEDLLHNFVYPDTVTALAVVVLFLPFLSFLVLFFFAKKLPGKGDWLGASILGFSFLLSLYLVYLTVDGSSHTMRLPWFSFVFEGKSWWFSVSILVDRFVALLMAMVTLISTLVHVYSMEYMHGKRNYGRYYPYLGIFTFSMLGILLSDNLLITFIFWELVGFSSYLLIGFWFDKESAIKASKKAFLFNRIGDTGFMLGILALFSVFGTFEISHINALVLQEGSGFDRETLFMTLAGLGIFMGCVGKSAQFPLQIWLPHAMEGPTPVSALIHAATMVAAGIYLLAKTFVFLNIDALTVIAYTGAITAFVGAVPALMQNDIKKVLAYSTISQLGYMVMGMGVQAYEASLFHLFTHAFFKACLFLSAGAVIHAMHEVKHHLFAKGDYTDFDSQDMRLMGGLYKKLPLVFYTYLISALSLIGIPFFSGFLSKDAILEASWNWAVIYGQESGINYIVPVLGFLTVFITAFYMVRQLLIVFGGKFKLGIKIPEAEKAFSTAVHMSSKIKVPLIVLAVLSTAFAFTVNPFSNTDVWLLGWLEAPVQTIHHIQDAGIHDVVPLWVMVIALVSAALGIVLAWYRYKPLEVHAKRKVRVTFLSERSFAGKLLYNNWHMDAFYYHTMVKGGMAVARISAFTDKKIIDGIINGWGFLMVALAYIIAFIDKHVVDGVVNLSGKASMALGRFFRSTQTGSIQGYLLFTILLVSLFILLLII